MIRGGKASCCPRSSRIVCGGCMLQAELRDNGDPSVFQRIRRISHAQPRWGSVVLPPSSWWWPGRIRRPATKRRAAVALAITASHSKMPTLLDGNGLQHGDPSKERCTPHSLGPLSSHLRSVLCSHMSDRTEDGSRMQNESCAMEKACILCGCRTSCSGDCRPLALLRSRCTVLINLNSA